MPSRESELYKDKIEVSLDSRQIFYLFFGGSVIVGLVFVLGVMVGRRVEARGHLDRAQTQTAVDPLAALDRLEAGSGLSFQGALTGGDPQSEVDRTIGDIEKKRAAAGGAAPAASAAPPKPAAVVVAPVVTPPAVVAPVVAPTAAVPVHAAASPSPSGDDAAASAHAAAGKSRFTLQLSSFQDKGEAQDYLASIKAAGYEAYLTSGQVDGKGKFYRVRVGSYRSLEAANDAKASFEKSQKKTVLVTRLTAD